MVNTLPSKQIGFAGIDKKSIIDIYHEFYTPIAEQQFGVVAIQVAVLK